MKIQKQEQYKSQQIETTKYKIKQWTKFFKGMSSSYIPFISELKILPAHDNTHVLIYQQTMSLIFCHFDKHGNVLARYEMDCEQFVDAQMFRDDVLVLLKKQEASDGILMQLMLCVLEKGLDKPIQQKNSSYKKHDYQYQISKFSSDQDDFINSQYKNSTSQKKKGEQKKVKSLNFTSHYLMLQNMKQIQEEIQIFSFSQSGILCICQYQFRMIYKPYFAQKIWFHYFEFNKNTRTLVKLKKIMHNVPLGQVQNQMRAIKVNQKSKIAIIAARTDYPKEILEVHLIDCCQNEQNKQSLKIRHEFQNKFPSFCQILVTEMWEIYPSTFYIKFESSINCESYNRSNKPQIKNYGQLYQQQQFIWDRKSGKFQKPTYSQLIQQQYYHVQFTHKLRQVKKLTKQIAIKVPTAQLKYFSPDQVQLIEPTIYLVSCYNNHQFIQQAIKIKGIMNSNDFTYPYFHGNKIMQYNFQRKYLQVIQKTCKQRLYEKRMSLCYLIMNILPDCDEDLLRISIELAE